MSKFEFLSGEKIKPEAEKPPVLSRYVPIVRRVTGQHAVLDMQEHALTLVGTMRDQWSFLRDLRRNPSSRDNRIWHKSWNLGEWVYSSENPRA